MASISSTCLVLPSTTLGLGMASSFAILTIVSAVKEYVLAPTSRKLFILISAILLFIEAILYSLFALTLQNHTRLVFSVIILLASFVCYFITTAAILRYSAVVISDRNRMVSVVLTSGAVFAFVFFFYAQTWYLIWTATSFVSYAWGYTALLLGIIPFGHVFCGIVLLRKSIRESRAKHLAFYEASLVLSFFCTLIWASFFVIYLTSQDVISYSLLLELLVTFVEIQISILTKKIENILESSIRSS